MNIIETSKDTFYAIGDIHGEFKSIANWIKRNSLHNCSLIFCGDFGLGFEKINKERLDLSKTNKLCEISNIDCYAVRGNHDNPAYYNGNIDLSLSHIHPINDYTIIKTPSKNILCIGGAVSTDRSYRISSYSTALTETMVRKHCSYEKAKKITGQCWWPDEGFIYDKDKIEEIIKSGINIDVICSHAAPSECYPITSTRVAYWSGMDESLNNDLTNERNNLSLLLNDLKSSGMNVKSWYHGHYHEHHTDTIDGVTFNLLDMGRNGRMSGGPGGFFDMKEIV